jgi:hypothetical protein
MWCQRLFEDVRACTCFYQNKDVTTTHGQFFNDTLRVQPLLLFDNNFIRVCWWNIKKKRGENFQKEIWF